jgi:hypothetical protein
MEPTDGLTEAAEKEWLEIWVAGPGDKRSKRLDSGTSAPDLELLDHTGTIRVSYAYQYCENFPDPRIFLTAAKII